MKLKKFQALLLIGLLSSLIICGNKPKTVITEEKELKPKTVVTEEKELQPKTVVTEEELKPITLSFGKSIPAKPLIMGINNIATRQNASQDFSNVLKVFGTTFYRYPGGTFSSYWDWQNNDFFGIKKAEAVLGRNKYRDRRNKKYERFKRTHSHVIDRHRYSMDAVAEFSKNANANITWVLNTVMDTRESLVKQVQCIKDKGYVLDYIELGNEVNGGAFKKRYPTVDDYAGEMELLIAEIKKIVPDVKIGAPSSGGDFMKKNEDPEMKSNNRKKIWEQKMRTLLPEAAYVTHNYIGLGSNVSMNAAGIPFILQCPYVMVRRAEEFMKGTDKKIWFTEYNIFKVDKTPLSGTMSHALYIATFCIEMMKSPTFEVANFHSLDGFFRMIQNANGDGPIFCGININDMKKITVFPVTELFSQLAYAVRKANSVKPVSFSPEPLVDGIGEWKGLKVPSLSGILFVNDTGSELVILNLGAEPAPISTEFLKGKDLKYAASIVMKDPASQVKAVITTSDTPLPLEYPVKPQTIDISGAEVTLAPYSYTKIIW